MSKCIFSVCAAQVSMIECIIKNNIYVKQKVTEKEEGK